MFANAMAISRLSALAGDKESAEDYSARAKALKSAMQSSLWNDEHEHFMDRYQVTSVFVAKQWR